MLPLHLPILSVLGFMATDFGIDIRLPGEPTVLVVGFYIFRLLGDDVCINEKTPLNNQSDSNTQLCIAGCIAFIHGNFPKCLF